MARRVVLHVGAMKSGTSYLQRLMMNNRQLLLDRGVLLPGRVWRDQVGGVVEILERKKVANAPRPGAWQSLVDEMAAWDGIGLISMEFLGPVGLRRIEKVVSTLPEGAVDVIVTARDLNRSIPAMWQESLKNGQSYTFDEYLTAIRESDGPGTAFWREQTIGAICRRWSDVLGAEHVTLVTVPPPGAPRDSLWRRFAEAVGVDSEGVTFPASANESLGAASVEVLRRLNIRLQDLEFPEYAPVVKHRLAKGVLAGRRDLESALGFDVPPWLPALSDAMIGRLRDLGVRVVGDLEELRPVSVPGVHPDPGPDDARLDAAVAGLEAVVRALIASRSAQSENAVQEQVAEPAPAEREPEAG